ncbi:Bona fide RidA/YjgF/TdcF/RutC subgroup [Clostridiaceae bacterium JG1575]|nr:Bona fide RidA/YjgF/TdcF/RutC subgroup [Clostridiaceae bacterium JG1575]
MKKKAILVDAAPAAVGPYSHANVIGDLVFVSGQLPLKNGELLEDIQEGTKACLTNLKTILEGVGSNLDQVVKVNIFLRDMGDFAAMNEVYATFFTQDEPARSCVAVKTLPKDARVEIEAIAHL